MDSLSLPYQVQGSASQAANALRRWAMGGGEKMVFFSLGPRDGVESLATAGGRWCGWKSVEIHGKHFLSCIAPEDQKIICRALEEVRAGREPPCSAARFLGKDGQFVPLVWRFAPGEQEGVVLGFAREFIPRASNHFGDFGASERKEEAQESSRPGSQRSPAAEGTTPNLADLLTGIISQCDLASLSLPPDSPVQGYLEQIKLSSMSVAKIVEFRATSPS